MKFFSTPLEGAYLIEVEMHHDERGYFARTWCEKEFQNQGIDVTWVQCNTSFNRLAGTLRGLHFQAEPHYEVKLIRCTRGAIFDVIVDLRKTSSSFTKQFQIELTEDNGRMLLVPGGMAHGFQTLIDSSEVFYHMSETYYPELARGIRWDDPQLAIPWPQNKNRIISDRDRNLPTLEQWLSEF